MRTKIYYFAILLLIFASCSKEDLEYNDISESSSDKIDSRRRQRTGLLEQ